MLEAGVATLQSKPPIEAINAYLDGFHFLNEDVIQCVIFDGNTKGAKIMGVEYIIDEKLFAALPAKEKAMRHSHGYKVFSGQLIAPGSLLLLNIP